MPCQHTGHGDVVEDAGRSAAVVSRFAQPAIPELRGVSREGSRIECEPGAAAMKAWTALLIFLPLAAQEPAPVAKTPAAQETKPASQETKPAALEAKQAAQEAAPAAAEA